MDDIVFITGNQHKADYLAKWLGIPIEHQKVDLTEIQSLDLRQVVADKAEKAYAIVMRPVLVEDIALSFDALGKLPGTFIKWFLAEIGNEGLCRLADGLPSRAATASSYYCLYDGKEFHFFESSMKGSIALHPRGDRGFGWDPIFIREGMTKTRGELDDAEQAATSMRTDVYTQIRAFLTKDK